MLAVVLVCGPARAASPVEPRLERQLRAAGPGAAVMADGLALADGTPLRLELRRFEVFAPSARIEEHGAGGRVTSVPVPSDRYFRGRVQGDPDSFVVVVAGRTLRGLVATRGEVFALGPENDAYRAAEPGPVRLAPLAAGTPGRRVALACANDAVAGGLLRPGAPRGPASASLAPLSTTVYDVKVALETDYELYQQLGSSAALASYLGDLVATASAIYLRDINTTISIPSISIWSTPSDPWTATDPLQALYEVGDYWHANRPRATYPRSTVHFVGHKGPLAGVAWIGVLCANDFAYGVHWGGGYGVTLGALGAFSTTNTSLYWDILAFTHEVGHNFNSPHTHCYSPPVDMCYSGESGCYSGPTSVPPEKGTIMSYCHLVAPGYSNNIVFYLGKPAQASQAVTSRMRTYVEGVSGCLTAGGPTPTPTPTRTPTPPGPTPTPTRTPTATPIPTPPAPSLLYTVSPCRVLDTRWAAGPLGGPALAATSTRAFALANVCGVPAGAKAVSLNVTITQPTAGGNLRVYPGDGPLPGTSSVSFGPGQTRACNALVAVSSDGQVRINVRNDAPGTVHLIVDVNGYYQ